MNDQTPVPSGKNYYEQYGDSVNTRNIIGSLLKFSKGDYLAGMENRLIPIGHRLVPVMTNLLVGWIKWENDKPVEQVMGLVAEGFQPPKRRTLGDVDSTQWAIDEGTNLPRDPWQFSNNLIMVDPDDMEIFTFTTASRGGLNALGDLCKLYGRQIRLPTHEAAFPVIELNVDSYKHQNPRFGIIKVPKFPIVGWQPGQPFVDLITQETGGSGGAQAQIEDNSEDAEAAAAQANLELQEPPQEAPANKKAGGKKTRF